MKAEVEEVRAHAEIDAAAAARAKAEGERLNAQVEAAQGQASAAEEHAAEVEALAAKAMAEVARLREQMAAEQARAAAAEAAAEAQIAQLREEAAAKIHALRTVRSSDTERFRDAELDAADLRTRSASQALVAAAEASLAEAWTEAASMASSRADEATTPPWLRAADVACFTPPASPPRRAASWTPPTKAEAMSSAPSAFEERSSRLQAALQDGRVTMEQQLAQQQMANALLRAQLLDLEAALETRQRADREAEAVKSPGPRRACGATRVSSSAASERDAALACADRVIDELNEVEVRAIAAEERASSLQAEVDALTAQLQNVILDKKRAAEQCTTPPSPSGTSASSSNLFGRLGGFSKGPAFAHIR